MAAMSVGGLIYASPYRNCSFGCAKGKKIITRETQTCQILIEKGCKWNFDSFTIIAHIPMPNSTVHFLKTTEKKTVMGIFSHFFTKNTCCRSCPMCFSLTTRPWEIPLALEQFFPSHLVPPWMTKLQKMKMMRYLDSSKKKSSSKSQS